MALRLFIPISRHVGIFWETAGAAAVPAVAIAASIESKQPR